MEERDRVLIYDGVCNLCNGVVRFIIERDPASRFRFAPMQGATARALIDRYHASDAELDTFLLITDGVCRTRSDAAIAIARELPRPWPLLAGFVVIPRPIRDFFYNLLANRRYRLFGRHESCVLPDASVADRFLL